MNPRQKSTLLFAAYILFVISVLLWLAKEVAYGGVSFPRIIKTISPLQGSGAELLISKTWKKQSAVIQFPAVIIMPPRQVTNILAWDYSDLSTVNNFRVYRGFTQGSYSSSNLTGKVLTTPFVWTSRTTNWVCVTAIGTNGLESDFSNEIRVPRIYTNLVITVSTSNATNLQWTTSIGKAWTKLGATNYIATNPPPRIWRAIGKVRPSLFISSTWQ